MKTTYIILIILIAATFWTIYRYQPAPLEAADTNNNYSGMETRTAVFAGGCFWCTESDFEKEKGVIAVISGYTGGHVKNPTYHQVSSGTTGHLESIKVIYDPTKVTYEELLDYFWRHVDPTDKGGQFVDRGNQYRSAIFYANEAQHQAALKSKQKLEASMHFKKPIVTDILPLGEFYPAEEYHQDYYKKNPIRYHFYRSRSGRDQFLKKEWPAMADKNMHNDKDMDNMKPKMEMKSDMNSDMNSKDKMSGSSTYMRPDTETLKKRLTPMQYKVAVEDGTEPPFKNEYWDNHKPGIYVDIISGEPLFSSVDKFDSGTGWPSFTRPIDPQYIVKKTDHSFFMTRTEVRSKHGNSHLGHVFDDGPAPTGLRYCINSASLRFVPEQNMQMEGYGKYLAQFKGE